MEAIAASKRGGGLGAAGAKNGGVWDGGDGVGVLGPLKWRENTRSWLQELHGGLQRLLYRERLLPVGVRPGPSWAPKTASEVADTRVVTPHDGISDVWGIERGGAVVRALIRQFVEQVVYIYILYFDGAGGGSSRNV